MELYTEFCSATASRSRLRSLLNIRKVLGSNPCAATACTEVSRGVS